MSYQFTLPGTRCTVKLEQPWYNWRNKDHCDADGMIKPDFVLMQEHIDDVTARMLKCTGKSRRKAIVGGVSRVYPHHGAAMDTRSYVRWFYVNNFGTKFHDARETVKDLFGDLSTNTQEWPGEPIEETME